MSFDGLCNIKLNKGNPDANSCAFGGLNGGVDLVKFDDSDRTQNWTIRPAEGPLDCYTIQSEAGEFYVIPQDDHLAYSHDRFVWIINGGLISNPKAPKSYWLPSDNGEFVIITSNSTWTWTISPVSS